MNKLHNTFVGLTSILCSCLSCHHGEAQEIKIYGYGTKSCASFTTAVWNDSYDSVAFGAWLGGFWTGSNYAGNKNVGFNVDFDGLEGEVKLICQQRPSITFSEAVEDAFLDIQQREAK